MIPFILTVASITLYALAGALGAYAMVRKVERMAAPSKVVFLVALAAQSAAIGLTSVNTSGTLMSGPNIIMLAAWVLAVVTCLLVLVGRRSHAFVAFAAPIAAVLIAASQVLAVVSAGASPSNEVYYEWPTLASHILLIMLGSAAFVVSASASAMMLYQKKLLRLKSERFLRISMPALSSLESVARRSAMVGLTLFTAGILIGFARFLALYTVMLAVGCQGDLIYLAPRMVLSVAVWLLYAAYSALSYLLPHAVSSKVRAWLSIAGLLLSVVLIVVSAG